MTVASGCSSVKRTLRSVVDARAEVPAAPQKVIGVGGPVYDDIEGLALYHGEGGDYR